MKSVVDIFNHMLITFHWASPYNFPDDFDVYCMILGCMDDFCTTGEYH